MKIVFFDVDRKINRELLQDMREERMNGNIVFVCSQKPYYKTYLQYFRYANGFVSNDCNYVQMGCCEVMRDVRHTPCEIESLYEKVRMYGTLILHGIRDSYVYKDTLSLKEYRLVPYAGQPVYSISIFLKDMKFFEEVNQSVKSEYEMKQEGKLLSDLHRRRVSLKDACMDVGRYFQIPAENMEIR